MAATCSIEDTSSIDDTIQRIHKIEIAYDSVTRVIKMINSDQQVWSLAQIVLFRIYLFLLSIHDIPSTSPLSQLHIHKELDVIIQRFLQHTHTTIDSKIQNIRILAGCAKVAGQDDVCLGVLRRLLNLLLLQESIDVTRIAQLIRQVMTLEKPANLIEVIGGFYKEIQRVINKGVAVAEKYPMAEKQWLIAFLYNQGRHYYQKRDINKAQAFVKVAMRVHDILAPQSQSDFRPTMAEALQSLNTQLKAHQIS